MKTLEILTSRSTTLIDLYPGIALTELYRHSNVYRESDLIASLFGARATPLQAVSETDRGLASKALSLLGVQQSDTIIYIHAGTSTPLKEYTPQFLQQLIRGAHAELTKANIPLESITFLVSPEPVQRPEVAAAIANEIRALGGRAFISPHGSFGLFRGLIARADAVLCADTAAGHLANALGVPCAALYGNPDPSVPASLWGPSGLKGKIPNTLVQECFSDTPLAFERFPERAGASQQQVEESQFAIAVIVAAAQEGWGSAFRKTHRAE